jgi:hypothetical protein
MVTHWSRSGTNRQQSYARRPQPTTVHKHTEHCFATRLEQMHHSITVRVPRPPFHTLCTHKCKRGYRT